MEKLEKIFFDAYSSHSDEIFRFIFFKLNDREKAKDLLQDVFMRTWVYMSRNGKIDNMRAFLYKAAGNRVIDEYRSQNKKENVVDSLEDLSEERGFDPAAEEAEALGESMDGEQAMRLIKELPQIYSEVLFLRYAENQSVSEIAAAMGESSNTVSVRLNRGLKKLKEMITERNNKHT